MRNLTLAEPRSVDQQMNLLADTLAVLSGRCYKLRTDGMMGCALELN